MTKVLLGKSKLYSSVGFTIIPKLVRSQLNIEDSNFRNYEIYWYYVPNQGVVLKVKKVNKGGE